MEDKCVRSIAVPQPIIYPSATAACRDRARVRPACARHFPVAKLAPARHAAGDGQQNQPIRSRSEPAETPHYHGHRERLRERFRNAGPDALSDYELLELALFPALPAARHQAAGQSAVEEFGSFAEVIHAPEARLREVEGIGDASINQLKLMAAARAGSPRAS